MFAKQGVRRSVCRPCLEEAGRPPFELPELGERVAEIIALDEPRSWVESRLVRMRAQPQGHAERRNGASVLRSPREVRTEGVGDLGRGHGHTYGDSWLAARLNLARRPNPTPDGQSNYPPGQFDADHATVSAVCSPIAVRPPILGVPLTCYPPQVLFFVICYRRQSKLPLPE